MSAQYCRECGVQLTTLDQVRGHLCGQHLGQKLEADRLEEAGREQREFDEKVEAEVLRRLGDKQR